MLGKPRGTENRFNRSRRARATRDWTRAIAVARTVKSDVPLVPTLVEHEKETIEAALAECQGRVSGPSGAANKLGIPRQTLDARIASLGIDKYRFKSR